MKKIIKQNLRFYSKFLLLIGALIAFVCSFGVSSYAWYDENNTLKSENILTFENGTYNGLGVTFQCRNNKIYLTGTAFSSGPLWVNVSIPSGSYVFQTFNNFTYNDGFRLTLRNGYSSIKASCSYDVENAYSVFTSNVEINILAISVVSGVNYNNVVLTPSLVQGSTPLTSYEEYGKTYYDYDVVEKASLMSYGCFKYASSIKVYYDNGTTTNLYKEFSNITDFTLEEYVRFTNNILYIDDYKLIFTLLHGNSNWKYAIDITFPSGKLKVGDFQEWYIYADSATNIDSFTSGVSYSTSVGGNPLVVDLTSQGFSSNDYIYKVIYTRRNPNIALAWGGIGTPNVNSTYYNNGYNSGYDVGYSDGYDSGFDDSKSEHYAMGYNDGFRDGEESDFTTNGFKTLIGSIFNYPINMIRSIFNFEFMGINIFSIIVFVMSIGIVIFVIRRFKK